MSDAETKAAREIKDGLKTLSERDGVCGAQRSFILGGHGTAFVACAMPPDHRTSKHEVTKVFEDGASVTYRWPV